jgi:hypothetical protein
MWTNNSMEQSTSWECTGRSYSLRLLWTQKVHCPVHKSANLVLILSQMNTVHIAPAYLFKINFNIVACSWRLYKTGIGLTTGFIGSHIVTHNYSVYTPTAHYSSLQHLPSLLTGCLSSNTWLGSHSKTDRRSARILTLPYSEDSLSATH